jgi:hypothetical protein
MLSTIRTINRQTKGHRLTGIQAGRQLMLQLSLLLLLLLQLMMMMVDGVSGVSVM